MYKNLLGYLICLIPFLLQAGGTLRFVPNAGQWQDPARYRMVQGNNTLFLEADRVTLSMLSLPHHGPGEFPREEALKGHAIRMRFLNANPTPLLQASQPFSELLHFYLSNRPHNWQENLHPYAEIIYRELYPGIDLRWYSESDQLKYDFMLSAGTDPARIQIRYEGADSLYLNTRGDLCIMTSLGEIREYAPQAYQPEGESRHPVACYFQLRGDTLSYHFPEAIDPGLPLVIDPVLVFGTYSGASTSNWGYTATYDGSGNAYGGGVIFAGGYPATPGAFQTSFQGGDRDVTLSKFSPDGSQLLYATYLGGSGLEQPHSMVAGPYDDLYVYGKTFSSDFPTSSSAYDSSYNGRGDIFITRLDSLGRLMASTYLGGTDADAVIYRGFGPPSPQPGPSPLLYNYGDDARGEIDLDPEGNCLIATVTASQDFPIRNIPLQGYQGGLDGCIARLSPNLDQLLWASYFGGTGEDAIYSLAPGENGLLFLCGGSSSPDLPTHAQAPYPTFSGDLDAFVARVNLNSSRIEGCSYLGSPAMEQAYFVETDQDTAVYIFGQTTGNLDSVGQVYRIFRAKQFITKLDAHLNQVEIQTTFGTFWSARPDISPTAFLVDNCGRIYVAGWGPTGQGPFQGIPPLTPDAFMDTTDGSHFYLAVFEKNMDSLLYATLLAELSPTGVRSSDEHVDGGTSRFDKQGVVYQAVCASCGGSSDFPTTPAAYSTLNGARSPGGIPGMGGGCNLALFKMDFQLPNLNAAFLPEDPEQQAFFKGCSPMEVHFHNLSSSPDPSTLFAWDFGDGSPLDSSQSPRHVYTQPGSYRVRLVAYNPQACDPWDTAYQTLEVFSATQVDVGPDLEICMGQAIPIQAQASGGSQYRWSPATGLSSPLVLSPVASPDSSTRYILEVSDQDECLSFDTLMLYVREPISLEVSADTGICEGSSTLLMAKGGSTYRWTPAEGLDDPTKATPIARPDSSSTYLVVANPDSVCSDSARIHITLIPRPFTEAWGSASRICAGQEVWLYARGGERIQWSNGREGDSIQVSPRDSTLYLATAFNGSCYSNTDSVFIEVLPYPVADFEMSVTEGFAPLQIAFLNTSRHANSYIWRFGDGSFQSTVVHPQHAFQDTGIFAINLEVSNELGCRNWKVKRIHVKGVSLFVADAFTPNGDGINDFFSLGSYGLKALEIRIYDRWGNKVYEASTPDFQWDGQYKGRMLPEGVYMYVIRAEGENGWEYPLKGSITLIR